MDQNKILLDLIKFKTFEGYKNRYNEVSALYDYVKKYISKKHYLFKEFERNGYQSLIIFKKNYLKSELVLQSHIDVVPGKPELFNPKITAGKLFGRGAADMKFAVATYIKVLDELKNSKKDFAVWLTDDEEIGSENGVDYLLNKLNLKTNLCFLPDGASNTLITKAKGVIHFKWGAIGKSIHGSIPWEGINAIDMLINAYLELKDLAFFKMADPNYWINSINLGKISGGDATNSVPQEAEMHIDIRFIDNTDYKKLLLSINKITNNYRLHFEQEAYGSAYALKFKDARVKKFIKALKYNNVVFKLEPEAGSTDARYFAEKNINSIIYKPLCDGEHADHEWLDLKSFKQFTQATIDWIKAL